jgi:hypothetical protein
VITVERYVLVPESIPMGPDTGPAIEGIGERHSEVGMLAIIEALRFELKLPPAIDGESDTCYEPGEKGNKRSLTPRHPIGV